MEARKLLYKSSVIGWRQFGKGPEAVICLHGYGESSRSFEFLAKYAGDRYSFYAIDLPFHGDSLWMEKEFTSNDLLEILDRICPGMRYTVLGFSLGGRVALSLYENRPANIDRLVLLAPDGLKVNFWYWFATQTIPGRGIFRFTMKNPGWFFGLLKLSNGLGLVNASVFKFVKYYIGDAEMRELLFNRWMSLRQMRPDLKLIKKKVPEYKTPVRVVYGRHDRIILSSVGRRFREGIEEYCTVTEIESGHQVLHEKHVEDILRALQG
jgi:pimeloyl-ACP methyl ester carboxylesterase